MALCPDRSPLVRVAGLGPEGDTSEPPRNASDRGRHCHRRLELLRGKHFFQAGMSNRV